jgi:hypothetical protein
MQVELSYRRDKLTVDLSEGLQVRVVRKPAMPVLSDPEAEVLKAMAQGSIQLYSTGLDEAQHALTGVARVESVSSAVRDSVEASGDNAVAVIPEGPYVIPVCRS